MTCSLLNDTISFENEVYRYVTTTIYDEKIRLHKLIQLVIFTLRLTVFI